MDAGRFGARNVAAVDPSPDFVELWEASGLVDASTGELWVRADYESFDDLFEPFAAGTGHSCPNAAFPPASVRAARRLRERCRGGRHGYPNAQWRMRRSGVGSSRKDRT